MDLKNHFEDYQGKLRNTKHNCRKSKELNENRGMTKSTAIHLFHQIKKCIAMTKKIVKVDAEKLQLMSRQIESMQNGLKELMNNNETQKPKFKLWVLQKGNRVRTYFSAVKENNECTEKTSLVKTMLELAERAKIAILYDNTTKKELFRVYYN